MTQPIHLSPGQAGRQLKFLVHSLSCLGAVSLLSGGMALAQTAPVVEAAPPVVESVPAPAAEPALPTYESLPSSVVESPVLPGPDLGAAAGASLNEPYIDPSSRYSIGATRREPPAVAQEGVAPVRVGPLAAGNGGFSVVGGTTASGRTYNASQPSTFDLRAYYNRTLRPPGRLGNGNIRLIFPLSVPAPITSLFGWRIHPISGDRRFHAGVDLGAPMGTPVLAAYAGRVIVADLLDGYGLTIALEHNKGTQQTLYAHLSEIFVKPGEWVKQGNAIGRVGSTGLSTGPHLHFEFRQQTADGWVTMDPGAQLEYALAELVKSLNTAQAKPAKPGA